MDVMKFERLGNICTVRNGYAFKSELFNEDGVPVIRISDINGNYVTSENSIRTPYDKAFEAFKLSKGDILIAMSGATTGKYGIYSSDEIGYQNQRVGCFVIKDKSVLDNNYLLQTLKFLKPKIERKAHGSGQPNISAKAIEDFEILLPPLPDQLHIANILSKAENLIAKRKESIRLLDEFLKSTFLEMFGDLKGEKVPLSTACIVNPKKSEINSLDKNIDVSFVPMAFVSEKGDVDLTQTKKLEDVWTGFTYFRENDVVFAKITPCMENGKGAIMKNLKNGIGFGTTEFHVLRPIEGVSTSEWIYHLTMQHSFRKKAEQNMSGSAGQKRVPSDYFDKVKVVMPPIELQTQFAQIVEKTEALKTQYQQSLQGLEKLYGSLSQKAFRGELGINQAAVQ